MIRTVPKVYIMHLDYTALYPEYWRTRRGSHYVTDVSSKVNIADTSIKL